MKVAIIGGAGRMGKWLIRHFKDLGFEVAISDVRREEAERTAKYYGVKLCETNLEAVSESDVTVISVPIGETLGVIDQVKGYLKKKSVLMEISSLKQDIIPGLRELSRLDIKPLSIHPLFGPSVEKLRERRLVLVPVYDRDEEREILADFFPNMKVITLESERHDRLMAVVLSLTYFMNGVFAHILSMEDISSLRKVGGTTFTLQLIISESIFMEDINLIQALLLNNKFGLSYMSEFAETSKRMVEWIKGGDEANIRRFLKETCNRLRLDPEFESSYRRMYEALSSVLK